MNKIIKKIMCINTKALQVGLALYAFLWGSWLLIYPSLFDASKSFNVLNEWGGELFWGSVLILMSISKVLALLLGKLVYRKIVSFLSIVIYGTVLLSLFASGSVTTIIPAFIAQTILSIWVLLALYLEEVCITRKES